MRLALSVARPEPERPDAVPEFERVYEDHFEFVWRSLRRLGVPQPALEDAVQEVFLVVHRQLAKFEGRSSLRTWLFGIAVHVARKACRDPIRRHAEEFSEQVTDPRTPQDEAARREKIRLLYAILNELDADKREVFVLCELEQMSAPEVTEVLGIPLNTVYSRLRTARFDFDAALKRIQAKRAWRRA